MSQRPTLPSVTVRGQLGYRLKKSYARLESGHYRPDTAFTDEENWPGDWPGRTILALVMLAQATGAEPAWLDSILEELDRRLNRKGYLGRVLPPGELDEQQLSGHSWLLRGLIEHYRWRREPRSLRTIRSIVENLFLPARGLYRQYPSDPNRREFDGDKSGSRTGRLVNGWYTSTDVGCAFIPLDGLTHAYELLGGEELRSLVEEMIDSFVSIDFVGVGMQTHATLSGTRSILRFYRATGEAKYLAYAKDLFSLYLRQGATENYANYNWFSKTDTWTEPCAVIDSYLVASELFDATGEVAYLETAHKIYYNAICYAQRVNGGFGCDTCVGPAGKLLGFRGEGIAEAYWCCTMRGADGLSRVAGNLFRREGDTLSVRDHHNATYTDGEIAVRMVTGFPRVGHTSLTVTNRGGLRQLELFVPSYAKEPTLLLDGTPVPVQPGMVRLALPDGESEITLDFGVELEKKAPFGENARKDCYTLWHGPLMLGAKTGEELSLPTAEPVLVGDAVYQAGAVTLIPLDFNIDEESMDPAASTVQVLF